MTEQRLLPGFGFGLGLLASALFLQSAFAAAAPTTQPSIEILMDTSDAPELATFAAQARAVATEWYPKIVAELPSDGFVAPRQVTLIFKYTDGVAYTTGTTITCSARWFTQHPDDLGAIVHELVHVVQSYRRGHTPAWVVEGIADYIRWFEYEPPGKRPHPNPRRAKYNDSYRTTAAFLDWARSNYDDQLVTKLNAACRAGNYRDAIWEQLTGRSVDALGDEWLQSLRGDAASSRPAGTFRPPVLR
jgi:hypothetical protein